jgi:hypothetical protein
MNTKQNIYINQALYPRVNRFSNGNFITSHFFGGWNRAFLPIRAYAFFEPDSSPGWEVYASPWWPYSMNIESITYLSGNTWAVTFVEPLFVALVSHNSGLTLVTVTNQNYNGFTIQLSGQKSAGEHVGIVVYK